MARNILIYGGCHAQVIRDLLAEVLAPGSFELSLLINFQLIASGQPFPYEDLRRYDVVIYSPIENHADYNTDKLREICAAIGSQCICFPWLEWHGYCIGAQKGNFKGRHQWYYPELQSLAERFSNFDAFYYYVTENFPDNQTIDRIFEDSTSIIRAAEARHQMDVRISDFISRNFRSSRLFLISDHPSIKIYSEIIAQILVALKCMPSGVVGLKEPQWQLRTPIFPRVAQKLGLEFSDSDWVDHELMPGQSWDLRTYLRLYFYPSALIFGPLENAQIYHHGVSNLQSGAQRGQVKTLVPPPETRLYARPEQQREGVSLETYELLEVLNGPRSLMGSGNSFAINPSEWRSTWTL